MNEQWKPIPGFEGYEVSDCGRVRSTKTGRILRGGLNPQNYRIAWLTNDTGQVIARKVASFVLEAFIGPRPTGMQICHADGDSQNDNLSNLRYDTPSNNIRDRLNIAHKYQRRLSGHTISAIRAEHAAGKTYRELAGRYKITPARISSICRRLTYGD